MNDTWWVRPDQLDDDQKKIIQLPLGANHLILGPPGSGKSNLLLLRANYAVRAGSKDIVILAFTRTLQEFIVTGAKRYAFSSDKVKTCGRWQRDLLWQYGKKCESLDNFEKQRIYFIKELTELINSQNLQPIHEIILLDEVQDYWPEEIEIFKKLGKTIFAVGDTRQKIYGGNDPLATLKALPSKVSILRYHYRNGIKICQLADALSKDKTGQELLCSTSNYDEKARPSTVEVHPHRDIDSQAREIVKKLVTQRKAYPDELLGVICVHKEDLSSVWEKIQASALAGDALLQKSDDYSSFDDKKICVCTAHSAKGLEFRALHLVGCNDLKMAHPRNVIFTGVTRAKTSLDIYHSSTLPGFIEQAITCLHPSPDPPTLEDLFGDGENNDLEEGQ